MRGRSVRGRNVESNWAEKAQREELERMALLIEMELQREQVRMELNESGKFERNRRGRSDFSNWSGRSGRWGYVRESWKREKRA